MAASSARRTSPTWSRSIGRWPRDRCAAADHVAARLVVAAVPADRLLWAELLPLAVAVVQVALEAEGVADGEADSPRIRWPSWRRISFRV